jgi:steroid 5-alpha reductase family enzyme
MLQDTILKFIHEDGWQLLTNGETPSGHLFHTWITVMLSAVLICFVVGEWTRNYSQVDKVWSLMPVAYSWITLAAFPSSPRLWLMTALITLWGVRLSYNFYRKGGYNILSFFIVIETIADNQQHLFQQQKRHKIPFNGQFTSSLGKGFMIEGLWSYVRHPNFAAEQAIWVSFYFMGIAASGQWINWTLIGPLLLILLFVGSTALTERVNSEKYPDYAAYKQNVPKFVPLLFKSTHRPHKSE